MMQDVRTFAASLVGKPYMAAGDGPEGYDCYGLVRVMVRKIYGIEMLDVPRQGHGIAEARRLFTQHASAAGWMSVESPMDLSVFLAGTRGRAAHCGICLRDGSGFGVLHAIDDMRTYGDARNYRGRVVFEPSGALHARGMVWVSYWKPHPASEPCGSMTIATAPATSTMQP